MHSTGGRSYTLLLLHCFAAAAKHTYFSGTDISTMSPNATEQRTRVRNVLAGTACVSPAAVYDPLSARIAQEIGYELGMLAGSEASNATLATPDIVLITLSELAALTRRIMRACSLSLIVDADHGYGNALNVMRTVQELEHAGASCVIIEDLVLPRRFGPGEKGAELVSIEEMTAKLRAALAARVDPALVISARIAALKGEGTEGAVARARAYAASGVDAIFITGLEKLGDIDAIHRSAGLPIVVGRAPDTLKREDLLERGARVLLQGHLPLQATVRALQKTYTHLLQQNL
jgi:carboxyvinyl-carboxyphosphonate phosphorylmutase